MTLHTTDAQAETNLGLPALTTTLPKQWFKIPVLTRVILYLSDQH